MGKEDNKDHKNVIPLTEEELDKVTGGFNILRWISNIVGSIKEGGHISNVSDATELRAGLTRPDIKNNGLDSNG